MVSATISRAGSTPAIRVLREAGVRFVEHAYRFDSRVRDLGMAAATELGVDAERVFKTLVLDTDPGVARAVIPVSTRLDPGAAARLLGVKRVSLAAPHEAERATGYVTGGVSPFGGRRMMPTVVDQSVLTVEVMYVSGGRRGLEIEMASDDLVHLLQARVGAIAGRPDTAR